MSGPPGRVLKILHVVRAPIGGIFRHILDLARGQIARGYEVGLIVDSLTGGERAQAALDAIAPDLSLGVARIPIRRELTPMDISGFTKVVRHIRRLSPDVVHGHGAKGGAFSRLSPLRGSAIRVYTPHGGSLHYGPNTLRGRVYGTLERILMARTDLFLFESAFARDTYVATIGRPPGLVRVVCNGVNDTEFEPIAPASDASDIVYVGEFRRIKGADVLIEAIARLNAGGRSVNLTLAGDGEEFDALKTQVAGLPCRDQIRFAGFVPARVGFSLGRLLVVPSRGDSLPYVLLEAAAAGVPMIASRVGGIPEVFGSETARLVAPENPAALADAIAAALDDPGALLASTKAIQVRVRQSFSQDVMVDGVLAAYAEALAVKDATKTTAPSH